ncbi:hypothetical protein [Roseateles sp. LYH14W]|uniref:DUF2946 domain-containing protein n=1 Tax=Pelomonas parva TaxID=3299032 RepID=A0ABW7F023_9BURK
MKVLRICLLVLLAVLLPVRGALAAAMVCAPAGSAMASPVAAQGDQGAMPCHMDLDGQPAASAVGEGDAPPHPDKTDRCNLCSASCSATPLLRDVPGIAEPGGLASASYPDVPAAAPSFLSDGQERPPRSL